MNLSNEFMNKYYILKEVAKEMGYKTIITNRGVSFCGHLTKEITVSVRNKENNGIFEFAHELGHCEQFRKRWIRLGEDKEIIKQYYRERDKSKFRFMLDEVDAWIRGYFLLRKNGIETKGYIAHAIYCVSTHFQTKPNTVKN